jgi:hypothetical protein
VAAAQLAILTVTANPNSAQSPARFWKTEFKHPSMTVECLRGNDKIAAVVN